MRILPIAAVCALAAPLLCSAEDPVPFKVEKHGTGKKAVILIPGLDCGASVWDGTVKALEGDYALYVLTLAGFDGVPAIQAPYCDAWVDAIAKWIEKEKIEKPVVVGHSLGGNLALRLAIAHPDLLGGIIPVDATPIFPPMVPNETIESRKAQMKALVEGMRKSDAEGFKKASLAYLRNAVTRKEDCENLLAMCVKADRDTHCGAFYELSTTDLRPDLPKVKVPVIVLAAVAPAEKEGPSAEDYAKATKASFEAIYQGTPRLAIVRIADAHHFVMYDQPSKTIEALKAALGEMK